MHMHILPCKVLHFCDPPATIFHKPADVKGQGYWKDETAWWCASFCFGSYAIHCVIMLCIVGKSTRARPGMYWNSFWFSIISSYTETLGIFSLFAHSKHSTFRHNQNVLQVENSNRQAPSMISKISTVLQLLVSMWNLFVFWCLLVNDKYNADILSSPALCVSSFAVIFQKTTILCSCLSSGRQSSETCVSCCHK